MSRSSLALLILLFAASASAHGQSVVPANRSTMTTAAQTRDDATRVVAALKRLDRDVLSYRALGEFEESGKLARVSFDVFKNDLREVTAEVVPLLSRSPKSRLKSDLSNALNSYRDGAWWWQKIDQARVVHSALAFSEPTRTSSDGALLANVPYTVAIHWRQAEKYLKRAEEILNQR